MECERLNDQDDENLLRNTLIRRLDATSENLAIATMTLFEAVVSLGNDSVMYNLVIRNLQSKGHLQPYIPQQEGIDGVSRFLSLFPACQAPCEGYEGYLRDAYAAMRLAPTQQPTTISPFPSPLMRRGGPSDAFYEGLFLHTLFNRLEQLFDHSLISNIRLTAVLTKLARYSHPLLRDFLLVPNLPLLPSLRSPYRILLQLAEAAKRKSNRFGKELRNLLDHTHQQLATTLFTVPASEAQGLLEGLVLLEEFCKELAATLHAYILITTTRLA
eukprot:TRINITY_DN4013_c0_g1_i4.p1 TRINITY_DN4013_c0_g1~~TRINITY_DN4013_c0_g1_i4.p1  ORF type:complete len:272 (+),score=20.79 TRINITY_DN4013_c0_g1_i4:792-1607(+)